MTTITVTFSMADADECAALVRDEVASMAARGMKLTRREIKLRDGQYNAELDFMEATP